MARRGFRSGLVLTRRLRIQEETARARARWSRSVKGVITNWVSWPKKNPIPVTTKTAEEQPRVSLSHRGVVSRRRDRKSTRLNSSHLVISYAVFCLKKKKKNTHTRHILLFDAKSVRRAFSAQHARPVLCDPTSHVVSPASTTQTLSSKCHGSCLTHD